VKDIRDSIKLGDVVAVTGSMESEHVLQAVTVTVLQAWKASHGPVAFKPQPSPLKQLHKEQQQQHRQTQQQQQQQPKHQQQDQQEGGNVNAGASHAAAVATSAAVPETAAAAAVVQEPQLAVCKFWVNTGRCAKGDACPYAHLVDSRKSWVKRRCVCVLGAECVRSSAAVTLVVSASAAGFWQNHRGLHIHPALQLNLRSATSCSMPDILQ
jgi:hypothetical protein